MTARSAALLFSLALAVRSLPWPVVLTPNGLHFFGNDAYYHMRRIAYALAHFPAALRFDSYLNYPEGAEAIWTPLFDWLLALLLLPGYALGGLETAEKIAVWIPPLLGAATVLVTHRIARQLFDLRVANLGAALLAVSSAHAWYSQIGFVDHHAAVSLGAACLLTATLGFVSRDAEQLQARGALTLGATMAALLLLWPGALLYVALSAAAFSVHAVGAASADQTARRFNHHAIAYAAAFAAVTPFCLAGGPAQWNAYSPAVLSRFQMWLFAALAMHAAILGQFTKRSSGATQRERWAAMLVIGTAIVGLSLTVLPELRDAASDAWRWLAKREAFQAAVGESLPLFQLDGKFSPTAALRRLSSFVAVFPFALAALAASLRGLRQPAPRLVFIAWATALALITLLQRRFFNTSSIALSLVLAWSTIAVWDFLAGRLARTRGRQIALAAAISVLVLLTLTPMLRSYRLPLANQLRYLRGEKLVVTRSIVEKRAVARAGHWLRANTPPTEGYDQATARPKYGVLANWERGHLLLYTAHRPMVVGNFGDDIGEQNFHRAQRYFASDEDPATAIARNLGALYVVSKAVEDPPRGRAAAMRRRLADPALRNLAHHRLIYESPQPESDRKRGLPPPVRIFEVVEGAVLIGQATPGARVRATLPIAVRGGTQRVAVAATRADPSGHFELTLAQASGGEVSPGIVTGMHWQVAVDGRAVRVAVDAQALRSGRRIPLLPASS